MNFNPKQFTFFLCLFILIGSCEYEGEEDFLDDYENCSEFCDYFVNYSDYNSEGQFETQGDCMSLCNTCNNPSASIATTAVCGCNWIQERMSITGDTWSEHSDGEFSNKGQCIKVMKARLNNN